MLTNAEERNGIMFRTRDIPEEVLQNMEEPAQKGSLLLGLLGSLAGAAAFLLASIVLWSCDLRFDWGAEASYLMLPLFFGSAVGGGYRLFHGRRSVWTAFVTVGLSTLLLSLVWLFALVVFLAYGRMGSDGPSVGLLCDTLLRMLPEIWREVVSADWELLIPYGALCLAGFLLTRGGLLRYADWKKAPWRTAAATAGGMTYNLLPERLPYGKTPERFCVGSRLAVEGEKLYVLSRFQRKRTFSVREIAGVVMGPSGGSNVLYGRNYQVLARFAGSMGNADLFIKYLMDYHILMTGMQPGWKPVWSQEPDAGAGAFLPESFTLRMEQKVRKRFITGGVFCMFLAGAALILVIYSRITGQLDAWGSAALALLCLFLAGVGFVLMRGVSNHRAEVDKDVLRVVSKWGQTREFFVREVASTSRAGGWLILYDRDWNRLEKLDLCLEGVPILERYLRERGAQERSETGRL